MPAPKSHEGAVTSMDGVFSRERDFRNGDPRTVMLFRRCAALIICAKGRIGADNQQVLASCESLVARACRQDHYVTGLEPQSASLGAAKSSQDFPSSVSLALSASSVTFNASC